MTSPQLESPRPLRRPLRADRPKKRIPTPVAKSVVFVASVVPLLLIAWWAYHDELGANPINEAEHMTGEWALRFLIFTLALTPVRRIFGWGELAKYRRMIGLFAFFYATVHLSIWVGVDMYFDLDDMWHDIVKHKYITVGMLAWLVMVPLALTSTKAMIRRLGGRRWRRLHQLTYAATVLGVIHFFWGVKKDLEDPTIFAAIIAVLLGWRLWDRRAKA